MRGIKLIALFLLSTSFFLAISNPTIANPKYGTLKIIAENENAEIFIDGAMAGHKIVTIEEIIVGTHQVKVVLGSTTIYEKMVLIQEGEQSTIVIKLEEMGNTKFKEPIKEEINTQINGLSLISQLSYGAYGRTGSVNSSV